MRRVFTLHRSACGPTCTLGTLSRDDWRVFTLEPGIDANHPAIPPGDYAVTMGWSPRFERRVPHVVDVPGRTDILVHPGNTSADTKGCILLGLTHGDEDVRHSVEAVRAFAIQVEAATASGDEAWLHVEDPTA
jgi:Family of unknown function (DUF5675)